jgi:hypothetical protein
MNAQENFIDLSGLQMPTPDPIADDLVNGIRVPVVFCERTPSNSFRFFCPYCNKYHYHGAAEGHVLAHCIAEDSPLLTTGYVLREIDVSPLPARRYKLRYLRDGRIVSGRPLPGRDPR